MKKSVLIIAFSLLGAGTSSAADMAVKAPPRPVAVANWTGCYVGLNGGYGWRDTTDYLRPSPDATSQAYWGGSFAAVGGEVARFYSYRMDGGMAGGQVGCNYQSGRFVVGIEGDIDWANISGSQRIHFANRPDPLDAFQSGHTLEWFGTVRGRAGFTATDALLLYVTGGVAFGGVRYNLTGGYNSTQDIQTIASSNTEVGWTAGVGAEWAFNPNWTVKAEYLYADLGSRSLVSVASGRAPNLPTTLTETFDNKYNLVRVGLNYRFNAGPVVAKY